MNDFSEQDLLLLAVKKGLICESDVITAATQKDEMLSPLAFLMQINLLTPEMVAELREEQDQYSIHIDETPTLDRSLGPSGNETDTFHFDRTKLFGENIKFMKTENDFPANWERYQYVRFLGEGGMGRVFLALDPRLQRYVAIKFIRGGDSELEQRFVNEAQAQARVHHKNLCEVYEVGKVSGKPFIVMQFVDGLPLHRLGPEVGLEQKLLLIKDVAEGLHEAHRSGLIHRDIKPSNIIVSMEGGVLKPVVLDFGLARQQATPGLTITGSVVGTPHYMPPEQARGETHQLDRRGDVYSLGASAYELLIGRPPFTGESAISVLFSVLHEEPQSLRMANRHIPEDVETIILKCMEKDPVRRYDSARALADDIHRYLNGEPIQARRSHIFYRLKKKAAKNKLAVTIGTAAFILLAVMMIWMWYQRSTIAEQSRQALKFGLEVQQMEDELRKVYLVPLHDVRPYITEVEKNIESIKSRLDSVGEVGAGPGNYAMGRAYMTLERYEEAKTYLQRSWDFNFHTPEAAYAMGVVLGKLYDQELNRLQDIQEEDERSRLQEELETNYRQPALKFLNQVTDSQVESPGYVRALLFYYEKRYDDALVQARTVYADKTWFYEALILQGDIYQAKGKDARNRGAYDTAIRDFNSAQKLYQKASEIGESDPMVFKRMADLALAYIQLEIYGPRNDITPYYETGIAACDKALIANSTNPEIFRVASDLNLRMAEKYRLSPESKTYLDQALNMAERAAQHGVATGDHYALTGRAYALQAEISNRSGEDPSQSFAKGFDAYTKAIGLSPTYGNYNRLGSLLKERGQYERRHGKNPENSWRLADEAYQNARGLNGSLIGVIYNQGALNYLQANYDLEFAKDPRPGLKKAITAYSAAMKINSKAPNLLIAQGEAYLMFVDYCIELGLPFTYEADRAQEMFEAALKIAPEADRALQGLGEVSLLRAKSELAKGSRSDSFLEKATSYLKQALLLNPNHYRPAHLMGNIYEEKAVAALLLGTNPNSFLNEARDSYRLAIVSNPQHIQSLTRMAEVCSAQARYKTQNKLDPSLEISSGLDFVERALAQDKTSYRPYLAKGMLFLAQAQALGRKRGDQTEPLSLAYENLSKAFSLAPKKECLFGLANWALQESLWLQNKQAKLPAAISQIADHLKALVKKDPSSGEARLLLGSLLLAQVKDSPDNSVALRKSGLDNLQEALKINGFLKASVNDVLAREKLSTAL